MSGIQIPKTAKQLMQILLDAGYEAYVVGGCVRDYLLGYVPHDWDICTNALPDQMKECFADYHIIETGLKHGTLTVMVDRVGYEITTFRTDGEYTDHRHPDSVSGRKPKSSKNTKRIFLETSICTANTTNQTFL